MNERIRELAHAAGLPTYNPEGIPTKLEKFAVLIVKECAELVRIQNEQFMENESHYGVVSADILKHFGVEQ